MIANPYVTRNIYSPQATAARGIKSTLPSRYYMGRTQQEGLVPAPVPASAPVKPVDTLDTAIYAPDPNIGGPPGEAFGSVAPGTEAFDPAYNVPPETVFPWTSQDEMSKGKRGVQFTLQTMNPQNIIKFATIPVKAIKDQMDLQSRGFDNSLQAQEFALDTTPVTNPETGLPQGFIGKGVPADIPSDVPVSPLADLDFGPSVTGPTFGVTGPDDGMMGAGYDGGFGGDAGFGGDLGAMGGAPGVGII